MGVKEGWRYIGGWL